MTNMVIRKFPEEREAELRRMYTEIDVISKSRMRYVHSTEALAEHFGVSRMTIWRTIKRLGISRRRKPTR